MHSTYLFILFEFSARPVRSDKNADPVSFSHWGFYNPIHDLVDMERRKVEATNKEDFGYGMEFYCPERKGWFIDQRTHPFIYSK